MDAFAGCGGLSLGLKRAGWTGLFAIEKDACAFETLDTNFRGRAGLDYQWPETIERQAWDVHGLLDQRRHALEAFRGKISLLAGGPPCQGFSHAGRRRNDDPRNRLFEDYLELVDVLQPALVLIENVRGFQSDFRVTDGNSIENFAAALRQRLSSAYHVNAAIIRAGDYGVPQVRPRFFLIGALKHQFEKAAVDSFFESLARERALFLSSNGLPSSSSARDAISDLEMARNGVKPSAECKGFEEIGYKEPRTPFQRLMRDGHEGAPSDLRLARHSPHIRTRFEAIIGACREEGRLGTAISKELRQRYSLKKMAIRVLDPLAAAPTITSLPDDLLHYSEPRALTVRENARLQTFPDWFSFRGKYTTGGERRRNEVPRFTQVANAVPPLLAEQLGLALLRLLRSKPVNMGAESPTNLPERLSV